MNPTTDTNAATPSRQDAEKIENVLASGIIDAAIEVHRSLGGPGLLESLYEEALSLRETIPKRCRSPPMEPIQAQKIASICRLGLPFLG